MASYYFYKAHSQWGSVVKILIEDITPSPTALSFTEDGQQLNRTLAPGGSQAEYCLTAPLQVDMTHVRSGEDLLLNGTVQGVLSGQCARCLETYPFTLSRSFSLVLTPQRSLGREVELSQDELSASFYSGEQVDLSALVHEQILLALPSVPLCREECRGLCDQCGTNLNRETCECRPAWHDPRLAIFATLRISPRE
jgi:uncharacterized protein